MINDGDRTLNCDKYEEGEHGLVLLNENGERHGYAPMSNVVCVEPTGDDELGDDVVDATDGEDPDDPDEDEEEDDEE
ncbi:hypothetical protein JCM17823_26780 [Halorubrum gandharaense]